MVVQDKGSRKVESKKTRRQSRVGRLIKKSIEGEKWVWSGTVKTETTRSTGTPRRVGDCPSRNQTKEGGNDCILCVRGVVHRG